MNCPIDEKLLALSLSGDLDGEQSTSMATHIKECETCRNVLAELQFSKHLLADSFEEPAEEDLRSVRIGIIDQLASDARRRVWPSVAAIAAGVTILFTAVLFRRNPDEHIHVAGTAQRSDIVVGARMLQTMPSVKPVRQVHRRVHRPVAPAGLKSVVLTSNGSGKPELRMVTADADVFIILQMDDSTHAN